MKLVGGGSSYGARPDELDLVKREFDKKKKKKKIKTTTSVKFIHLRQLRDEKVTAW